MSAEKDWCRQEHELDTTEHVVGAVVDRQVLGMRSNVDMPGVRLWLKMGLEYTQDE